MKLSPIPITFLGIQHRCAPHPDNLPAAIEYRTLHGIGCFYVFVRFAQPPLNNGTPVSAVKFLQTDACWQVLLYPEGCTEPDRPFFELSHEALHTLLDRFDISLPPSVLPDS